MLKFHFEKPMRICVVDCAITSPAYQCFNKLVQTFNLPMEYHLIPINGVQSLHRNQKADAYLLFGSSSNICDRFDWQTDLARFAKEKLEEKIPVLGICFGHQLMADYFGGTVDLVTKDGKSYEGTRQFSVLQNQWGFRQGEVLRIFKCHRYEVKNLPDSFENLGSSSECSHELVRHKHLPYLGVQGHPEASWDFYETLTPPPVGAEIEEASNDGLSIIHRFLMMAQKLLSV
ncbi:MAG: gamma-glutamyl-gamma-aminobutyrate hydrolase family protein [Bdellovibrio sp.]|nr:gamma-glutamyl-gamma-aminobutyrate hydrolase family protein [Bdellovibrio sp.]